MKKYRNIFLDKDQRKMVAVEIDLKEAVVEEEEVNQESLAEEYDIKGGYKHGKGHISSANIETSLRFELSLQRGGNSYQRATSTMETDAKILEGHRGVRGAMQVLFNNYILTNMMETNNGGNRNSRFRYTISSGSIPVFREDSRHGLGLSHFLLKREGTIMENLGSHDVWSNIYSEGTTCHGSMGEASSWARNKGLTMDNPKALCNTYQLFKGGVGNHDLSGSNSTRNIRHGEVKEMLEEFQELYVDKLENENQKSKLTTYINSFIIGLEDKGLSRSSDFGVVYIAPIIDKTSSFYIEDYL